MNENIFYNNEFKQEFLNREKERGQQITLYANIFEKAKPIESKTDRDLYTFSDKDIIKILQSFGYMTVTNFYHFKGKIKQYLAYAYEKGCTSERPENVLYEVTYTSLGLDEDSRDFRNKYYRSYDHMIETFDRVMEDSNSITTIRIKIMISLVFWGMPKEDLLKLTVDDVNFLDRTVYSQTLKEHIKMPSEVITLCLASANEQEFKDETGRKTQVVDPKTVIKLKSNTKERNIEPSKIINSTFKMFTKTWEENVKKLPEEIRADYADKTFTLKNIEKNGFIWNIYQKETEQKNKFTNNADFMRAANIKSPSTGYTYWKLYIQWKRAYNL